MVHVCGRLTYAVHCFNWSPAAAAWQAVLAHLPFGSTRITAGSRLSSTESVTFAFLAVLVTSIDLGMELTAGRYIYSDQG